MYLKNVNIAKYLFKDPGNLKNIAYASHVALKPKTNEKEIIISCRRKEYNFYKDEKYTKFDEIALASKGWNHSKAKGDFFVIHPFNNYHEEIYKPITELNYNASLVKSLQDQNIDALTSFQYDAANIIYNGNNAILAAETGCGKTLSYLLPILQKLLKRNSEQLNSPGALVIIPNRELAHQIGVVAEPLAKALGLNVKVIVGGRTKRIMLNPEFSTVDLLIGTPGAIGKLSNVGIYKLNDVSITVLDEADTLIDDSFVDRLTGIIKRVSQSQLVLVSATLPKKIPPILEPYEQSFKQLTSPLLHKPLSNITQKFLRLIRSGKPPHILQIAKKVTSPLLIFTNRNETCNWVAKFFKDNNVQSVRINGDMNYLTRIEQWNDFTNGKVNILVATDVCSRGLNTTQVNHVVNYDFPLYAADYIHRIGRTGRFGSPSSCKVTNFISGPEEIRLVQKIEVNIGNYVHLFS